MHRNRILLYYGISLVAVLAVRTLQLLFVIEPNTGFFYRDNQTLGRWMTVFLIGALAGTVLLAAFVRQPLRRPARPGIALGVVAIFAGLTLFYESLFGEFTRTLTAQWAVLAEMTLALLGAAALVWYGLTAFVALPYSPLLMLLPLLHAFVHLALSFAEYTSLSNTADNLFDIAMLCAVLLLLLGVAKTQAGVDLERAAARLLPAGLLASQLCFTCAIPPAIAALVQGAPLKHGTATGFLADLTMGLFALLYPLSLRAGADARPEDDPDAPMPLLEGDVLVPRAPEEPAKPDEAPGPEGHDA